MKFEKNLVFLRSHGWLATLPDDLQKSIERQLLFRRIKKGFMPFSIGSEPGGMVGLAEGCLEIEVLVGVRSPQPCYLLHAGAWAGAAAAAHRTSRIMGVRATRSSVVAYLERKALLEIADRNPIMWKHLLDLSQQHNLRMLRMADALMERDSYKRLALILVQLAGYYDGYGVRPALVNFDQVTLGGIINLSKSALSPLLNRMQQDGMVTIERGAIRLLDVEQLEAIAWS